MVLFRRQGPHALAQADLELTGYSGTCHSLSAPASHVLGLKGCAPVSGSNRLGGGMKKKGQRLGYPRTAASLPRSLAMVGALLWQASLSNSSLRHLKNSFRLLVLHPRLVIDFLKLVRDGSFLPSVRL